MTRRYGKLMRREPLGVTQRANRAVMLAQISDPAQRARFLADFPESNLRSLPKKRGPRVDHADLEKHTQSAVADLLAVHPKVLFACRQNSGGMQYQGADGDTHNMWFYRIITKQEVRISDYWGILRDGRMMAMECKRPSWKAPSDKREYEQAAFLMLVRNCGGIAGFVRNVDEANALLA